MRKIVALPLISTLVISIGVLQSRIAIAQEDAVCVSGQGNSATSHGCWIGQRSLTAIGQGLVIAPADVALMEFRFSSREQLETNTASPGLSISTARQFTEEALQPVINALKSAGVPSSNIKIQTSSIQNPKVLAKLNKPTQEGIQKIVLTVDQSLKSNQQIFLQSIGAQYSVNSCEPLERTARRIALQDAQKQLTTLAQDVKVQMGELLSVTVLPLTGSSSSVGCGTKIGVPTTPFSLTTDEATPPYNPSDKPEVQVRSQVSVTHAIKSPAASTSNQ